MARIKCIDMINAIMRFKHAHKRIYYFAIMCGLEEESLYMPTTCDLFLSVLRYVFPNHAGIREKLEKGYGHCLVPSKKINRSLIGEEASEKNYTTWHNPFLEKICPLTRIRVLMDNISQLPGMKDDKKKVDLDLYTGIVLDFFLEELKLRDREILQAFTVFDVDKSGDLGKDEFFEAMHVFTGGSYTKEDIEMLYEEVVECDTSGGGLLDIGPSSFSALCRKHDIYMDGYGKEQREKMIFQSKYTSIIECITTMERAAKFPDSHIFFEKVRGCLDEVMEQKCEFEVEQRKARQEDLDKKGMLQPILREEQEENQGYPEQIPEGTV